MTSATHTIRYAYADYLALEESSNVKHEFLDGQIYAMAGGTPEHAALIASLTGVLFGSLRGGDCRAYSSDLRVRTPSGLSTYPDVTVVCGRTERDPTDPNAIANPLLIAEVESRSTGEYDRGDKFEHYKSLGSLRQYVLVSWRERRIDVWTRRDEGGWTMQSAGEGQVADLVIGVRLDVGSLYESAAEPSSLE